MPHPRNDLQGCGVAKVELLDEVKNVGNVKGPPCILVSSFGGVLEKGSIPHGRRPLLVPFPWIPGEVFNETRLKDLVDWSFFTWSWGFPSHSEGCPMPFLCKDSNWVVILD
jgi:hypothetical protein